MAVLQGVYHHHHHHDVLLLLLGVHLRRVRLVPVVLLVLPVFLMPGRLPLLLLGVHLLGVVPLHVTTELLPITYPLPMTVVTTIVLIARMLVHLYAVACMVALGVLARLVVVVVRGVVGELLDKEI